MSVANGMAEVDSPAPSITDRAVDRASSARESVEETAAEVKEAAQAGPELNFDNARRVGEARLEKKMEGEEMEQMGAKRIGSLAIGIGVVGIVLNQMSNMDVVTNSTGVVDVQSIFDTAGSGLQLLVVGVIIAAAAVLLNLWSGF